MNNSTSTWKSATVSDMDYQKSNHGSVLDTLVERNASNLAERLERMKLSKGTVGVGRASNGGGHEGNKVSEALLLPRKRNAHSGTGSGSGDGQSKAESGSGDGQSKNGILLPLKEPVNNINSMHDNKGKCLHREGFGQIEDDRQNRKLQNAHEENILVNKNGDGQSPAGSKNGDGRSPVKSKSGDGRNIYYLHTCHQRTHESVDQFFIRCKIYADKCQLDKVQYEQRLLEQLILGTAYEKVREKILEENLSLSEALEVAREIEMKIDESRIPRQPQHQEAEIIQSNRMPREQRHREQEVIQCNNCATEHEKWPRESCTAYGKYCTKCGKINHNEAACRWVDYRQLCTFCGLVHLPGRRHCPAFGNKCKKCGMENHTANMCRSKFSMGLLRAPGNFHRAPGKFHSFSAEHDSDNTYVCDADWD